ncbi:hypothetical protein M3P05_01500 [Sansalvadorimonas sp. 2012CJ34-2]|uniref:DUF4139 domain-containing protein n=1 Tax=Parendozoicomonas callyspongiae TaxID=2942213 RepID=A0ABT0PBG7_9GAMM|nr:hypothetical protein [Sansalvadorimonas sp. 2012CJ34-2]MCL6268628.1 hypothetical protein [Sansalvadorimonas sp. 2012CJ34-2]
MTKPMRLIRGQVKALSLVMVPLALAVSSGSWAASVSVDMEKATSTQLTMYSGQTLVSQALDKKLPAGESTLRLRPDFDHWDLPTLQLAARDGSRQHLPDSIFWRRTISDHDQLMQQLVGQQVELKRSGTGSSIKGTLIDWQQGAGVLLLDDGRQDIFQWDNGMSVRTVGTNALPVQKFAPMLEASFSLQQPSKAVNLTYLNHGLQYGNQYRMVTVPADSTLDLNLSAHLVNNSLTSYGSATLQLASGDLGRNSGGGQFMSRKMVTMAAEADMGAERQRFGDLLFIDVPGKYTLPAGGELNVPLLNQKGSSYTSRYKYSFYGNSHPGNRSVKEHPRRTLAFNAEGDLPAGPLQVLEKDREGSLKIVNFGSIPQTSAGQPVEIALGEAYTLTVERRRLATRQYDSSWKADWQLTVTNSQERDADLLIEDTDYSLMKVEPDKGARADKGLLSVSIPAGKTVTVTFTSTYRKN